mmetsp:Transcript_39084/g.93376  ORF Transcript_39084/g.93376 Transcript_39084/m.93376 type:complete len:237 (+) Transcript_39084:162-872(+)
MMRSQSAPMMAPCTAKQRKSTPPAVTTMRSEMCSASTRPPSTASVVQHEWPMMPPSVTPKGSLAAASAMVEIWDRSPHSARKVSVKAWMAMAQLFFSLALLSLRLCSTSSSSSLGPTPPPLRSIWKASRRSLMPKYTKSPTAAQCVYSRGISFGSTRPMVALSAVMAASAPAAPKKTARRSCRMASSAAMKKVLSPSSVTRIIRKLLLKASCREPSSAKSLVVSRRVLFPVAMFRL